MDYGIVTYILLSYERSSILNPIPEFPPPPPSALPSDTATEVDMREPGAVPADVEALMATGVGWGLLLEELSPISQN